MKFETALVSEDGMGGKKKKKKKKKKKMMDDGETEEVDELDPAHEEAMARTQEEMRRLEEENMRLQKEEERINELKRKQEQETREDEERKVALERANQQRPEDPAEGSVPESEDHPKTGAVRPPPVDTTAEIREAHNLFI